MTSYLLYFLDEASFTLADIAKYMTGSFTISPGGVPTLKLYFKHDCEENCKCLPTASTCAMHIIIPVHTNTLKSISECFSTALTATSSYGFGFA